MKKNGFSLIELMITVTIVGILAGAAIVNYRSTITNSNARLAARVLQTVFARESIIGYESANSGISCSGLADCAGKLNIEVPSSFPGVICYNASCAGGCAQANGGTLGGTYSISNANTTVNSTACPCPCP